MIDRATQQQRDAEHRHLRAVVNEQAAELTAAKATIRTARERIAELERDNWSLRLERQEMGQALDQLLEAPDLAALRAGVAAGEAGEAT